MERLINVIKDELQLLLTEKEQSIQFEEQLINAPFKDFETKISEKNRIAKKEIENSIRKTVVKWKNKERKYNIKLKELKALSVAFFGISQPKLLEDKLKIDYKWYHLVSKKREELAQANSLIEANNLTQWANIPVVDYVKISLQNEARELENLLKIENNSLLQPDDRAKLDEFQTQVRAGFEILHKLEKLEIKLYNHSNLSNKSNPVNIEIIKNTTLEIKALKTAMRDLEFNRQTFYNIFCPTYNDQVETLSIDELSNRIDIDIENLQAEKTKLINERTINLQTSLYLENKIKQMVNINKLNNESRIKALDPKDYSTEKFLQILEQWNKPIHILIQKYQQFNALKENLVIEWKNKYGNFADPEVNVKILDIINDEYEKGILYTNDEGIEISEKNYLELFDEKSTANKKLLATIENDAVNLWDQVKNGNLTLNRKLEKWIADFNNTSNKLNKLVEHQYEHTGKYSDDDFKEISNMQRLHSHLQTSLFIFQNKTKLNYDWTQELPMELPETNAETSIVDVTTSIKNLPCLSNNIIKEFQKMLIADNTIETQNNGMAVVLNREIDAKIGGQGVGIKMPKLCILPPNIKTFISASGTIAQRDDSHLISKSHGIIEEVSDTVDSSSSNLLRSSEISSRSLQIPLSTESSYIDSPDVFSEDVSFS